MVSSKNGTAKTAYLSIPVDTEFKRRVQAKAKADRRPVADWVRLQLEAALRRQPAVE